MIKNSSKDIRFLSFYFFVVPFSKPSTVINERLNKSSARFYIFSCDLVVVGYWLWLCWCCCLLFSLTCVSHAIVGTSAAQDFYRNLGVRHQRHTTAQSVHRGDTTERKKWRQNEIRKPIYAYGNIRVSVLCFFIILFHICVCVCVLCPVFSTHFSLFKSSSVTRVVGRSCWSFHFVVVVLFRALNDKWERNFKLSSNWEENKHNFWVKWMKAKELMVMPDTLFTCIVL